MKAAIGRFCFWVWLRLTPAVVLREVASHFADSSETERQAGNVDRAQNWANAANLIRAEIARRAA